MTQLLKAFMEENFPEGDLVVLSNREPYVHRKAGSEIKVEQPAGGLTSALDDVLKATGGTWVAWGSGSEDRQAVDEKCRVPVPPRNPAYTLKRVWLTPTVVDNYYHGYANRVLWPLCHITLDRIYYRQRFWKDYKRANQAFAEAALEEIKKSSMVWVHDYQLCLVPQFLRKKRPELIIGHFWHIPWPDWSVFRICPQATEILEGLLGNDLIGFQIPLFASNFMGCVREAIPEAEVDFQASAIVYQGRTIRLKAFPISVDYEKFNRLAASKRTEKAMAALKEEYGLPEYVGIGVDRLEYTKALIKRLQALDLLFERYKWLKGRFTFIQIAVPTRMEEPYASYKKAVEEFIERINHKYGTGRWKPILHISEKIDHKDLAAYYRLADVAIISSVYDGMNLVAKEYAACQVDRKGTLILSEFAGAAEELAGAIPLNPYDIEQFSESIRKALTMPEKEKALRMEALRNQVRENNIYHWIFDILHEMIVLSAMKNQHCRYILPLPLPVKKALTRNSPFLFLDYDGTLTPIVETPEKAVISEEMRSLILRLKKHMPVAIMSGRSLRDIRERVGISNLIYAGNHGAQIWAGSKVALNQQSVQDRKLLEECLLRLRKELSPIKGALIEDKGVTASIHFRLVDSAELASFFEKFQKVTKSYERKFRITTGKKVFELRPLQAWNKGDAVRWVMKTLGKGKHPIYLGDDTTDEDAFRAIKKSGIAISVGGSEEAHYYLKTQSEAGELLHKFLDLAVKRGENLVNRRK